MQKPSRLRHLLAVLDRAHGGSVMFTEHIDYEDEREVERAVRIYAATRRQPCQIAGYVDGEQWICGPDGEERVETCAPSVDVRVGRAPRQRRLAPEVVLEPYRLPRRQSCIRRAPRTPRRRGGGRRAARRTARSTRAGPGDSSGDPPPAEDGDPAGVAAVGGAA